MIYLEQTVNQILREEGQVIVSLEDLQITWEELENLFIGIYEQSKQYISIYDWVQEFAGLSPTEKDFSHIRHMTFNAYFQRMMPDIPSYTWEYNPYTKKASSMMNTTFGIEAGKYPTLEQLDYSIKLDLKENMKKVFMLPCTFRCEDFTFGDFQAFPDEKHRRSLILEADHGVGRFDMDKLTGYIIMDKDYSGELKVKSKYVGIKELDLSCELFYIWFKAALMCYIGSQKKQLDLTGVGLPFDINADGLLERGRQLMDKVEELKCKKQHWSNF